MGKPELVLLLCKEIISWEALFRTDRSQEKVQEALLGLIVQHRLAMLSLMELLHLIIHLKRKEIFLIQEI
jgi:hypothetical protein